MLSPATDFCIHFRSRLCNLDNNQIWAYWEVLSIKSPLTIAASSWAHTGVRTWAWGLLIPKSARSDRKLSATQRGTNCQHHSAFTVEGTRVGTAGTWLHSRWQCARDLPQVCVTPESPCNSAHGRVQPSSGWPGQPVGLKSQEFIACSLLAGCLALCTQEMPGRRQGHKELFQLVLVICRAPDQQMCV